MPNGVSCAYFATRNHIYGKRENNIFREGIAGAQTVRTADAVAQSSVVASHVSTPVKGFLSKAASFAKKLVYPLIIGSGIYNTVRSDDKVKTGASQVGAIGTMFAFEQIVEKLLKNVDKKIADNPAVKNSRPLRWTWYVLKGLTYATSSMLGYNIGSAGAEKMIEKARAKRANKTQKFPVEDDLKKEDIKSTLFEDMKL